MNWRKKAKTDIVKGLKFELLKQRETTRRMGKYGVEKYQGMTSTWVQMHNHSREEWAEGIHSIAQVPEWPAYSKKLEEFPKAKEKNELGWVWSRFKYCNAWLTPSHVAL